MSDRGGVVQIGPVNVPIWPEGVRIVELDPKVCVAIFPDNDLIRSVAEPQLLEAEKRFREADPDRWVGAGGAKIRDIASWPCPALRLLHERVKEAYRRLARTPSAVIDDCWANVYRQSEFIGPHSHRRTEVSVVYHLTPPDEEDRDQFNGALGICDPRVTRCCPTKQGLVTSQVFPPLEPGTMVLFPSFVTHYVTPHRGTQPRISLAWNIASEPIPGSASDESLL